MKFRKINEKYLVDNNKDIVSVLKDVSFELNGIKNDFIYLHLNSFGMSFKTLHEKLDKYYNKLSDNLDYVLEIIAQYNSNERECVPFNLNDFNNYKGLNKNCLSSEESFVNSCLSVTYNLISQLDILRDTIDNDSIISEIDSIASYWTKEYNYLARRFVK